MDGGDYFGVSDGQTRVIPGQKSASGRSYLISAKPVYGELPVCRPHTQDRRIYPVR